MPLEKIGQISNQSHHAHPVIICDATARYGGFSDYESEIVEGNTPLDLDGKVACIADGGDGELDVFRQGDQIVLISSRPEEQLPPPGEVVKLLGDRPAITTVDVPSGKLAVGVAYATLNVEEDLDAGYSSHEEGELMILEVDASRLDTFADEVKVGEEYVWLIVVQPAK